MNVDTVMVGSGQGQDSSMADIDMDEVREVVPYVSEPAPEHFIPSPPAAHLAQEAIDSNMTVDLPSAPIDLKPDITSFPPPDIVDNLESVAPSRQQSPLALAPRRSTRRSRSATQLIQPKDELESSDEEALATKVLPRRATRLQSNAPAGPSTPTSTSASTKKRKSATASVAGTADIDVAMLDSGPSSRFQSPAPRPSQPTPVVEGKIFSGLVFWVDLSIKNRGDLLKEIKVFLLQSKPQLLADMRDCRREDRSEPRGCHACPDP
jgi:hypothetical protein